MLQQYKSCTAVLLDLALRSATLQPALAAFPGRYWLCHKLVDEFRQGSTAATALGLKQQSITAVQQETPRAGLQLRAVRRHHTWAVPNMEASCSLCPCLLQHAHLEGLYCSAWPPHVSTAHLPMSGPSLYHNSSRSCMAPSNICYQPPLWVYPSSMHSLMHAPCTCTCMAAVFTVQVQCNVAQLDPNSGLCSGAGPST